MIRGRVVRQHMHAVLQCLNVHWTHWTHLCATFPPCDPTCTFVTQVGHADLKRAIVLGLLAREHVYVEGPPGTNRCQKCSCIYWG